jgi:allantoicase
MASSTTTANDDDQQHMIMINDIDNDDDASKSRGMHHSASITAVAEFNLEPAKNVSPPSPFERQSLENGHMNLTSTAKGARVLFATDEWFATADNLLKDTPPIFDPDAFCEQGKVMDGWESRRRREAGHDWCVIKLPSRACCQGIEIDTAHFTGNQVPLISLQVADLTCTQETIMVMNFPGALERLLHGGVQGTGATPEEVSQGEETASKVEWNELLPKTPLRPGYEQTRMHYFTLDKPVQGTHIRINYYPDGGVARLRIWGSILGKLGPKARPAYAPIKTGRTCTVVSHTDGETLLPSSQSYHDPELSLAEHGGLGLACSNKHYGHPTNLIQSNLGRDMGDGWETARHPDRPSVLVRHPTTNLVDSPLMDWAILKLGQVCETGITRVILDTKHFRGNYPESVQVEACYTELSDTIMTEAHDIEWFPLVARGRMAPDSEHVFLKSQDQIANCERKVSHVKISIYPDGGLSRVRVYGNSTKSESSD